MCQGKKKFANSILIIWQILVITFSLTAIYVHDLNVIYKIAGIYIQNSVFYFIIFLPFILISFVKNLGKLSLVASFVLSIIALFFNLFNLIYFKRYGYSLTSTDFEILFQSNIDESIAFLEYFNFNIIATSLSLLAVALFVGIILTKTIIKLNKKPLIISYSSILILFGFIFFKNEYRILKIEVTNPIITCYKSSINFKNENNAFLKAQLEFLEQIKAKSRTENDTNTIVLILGESTQRNHMSLYGYNLETSPLLQKRKKELLIFKDVISPDSHTIPVLKHIFSSRQSGDKTNWTNYPNLINVFKKAGYSSYWISNQEAQSFWGNTALNISQLCDKQYFTETRENQKESKKFDEMILPYVQNIMNKKEQSKKLIIVHLMGTHDQYSDRYPEKYNKFSSKDIDGSKRKYLTEERKRIIANYDNAVLYNDMIVDNIFSMIDQSSNKTVGLYLSDHGEELFDFRPFSGHSGQNMSAPMVEIPFIISSNERYKKSNQDVLKQLKKSVNTPFASENLPFLLYSLANIETNLQDKSKDLSDPSFIVNNNRSSNGNLYKTLLGNKEIVQNHDFLERLWIHRVNSAEKLSRLQSIKKNVEVDLILEMDSNNSIQILVGHDQSDPTNFPISKYFEVIKNNKQIKLWLDLKNINSNNFDHFITRFEQLLLIYNLDKTQFILESVDINIAKQFKTNGYQSSFYIWVDNVHNLSEKEKEKKLLQLFSVVEESKLTRLSFDHNLILPAKNIFQEKLPYIKFYSWNTGKYYRKDQIYASQQLMDTLIDIFLVKYKTEFDR